MSTLLEIVGEFCSRLGLEIPTAISSSADAGVLQYRGLANEVVLNITSRGESWPLLQKQAVFTSTGAVSQGLLTTIFPYGFKNIQPDTAYDRTLRRQLFGPKSDSSWQESLALPFTGPFYAYRIWQGQFMIQPTLPAGDTIALEYSSDYAIQATDGVTYKKRFTADTDVFLLDEEMLILGLQWRWKAVKGLPAATEMQSFESYLAQEMGTSGDKGVLSMDGCTVPEIKPGIWVSAGNWPL